MKLSTIKIPYIFKKTSPKNEKIIMCENYYLEHGKLDKPITINQERILVDGYVRYLVAEKLHLEDIPVKRIGEPRIYVQAKHAADGKDYWWKVKKIDEQNFMNRVHKGDCIMVNTKKGLCTVTVNDIVVRNTKPIERHIKTIVRF